MCYVYGVDRYQADLAEMLRVQPPLDASAAAASGESRARTFVRRVRYFFGPSGGYVSFGRQKILFALLKQISEETVFYFRRFIHPSLAAAHFAAKSLRCKT